MFLFCIFVIVQDYSIGLEDVKVVFVEYGDYQ